MRAREEYRVKVLGSDSVVLRKAGEGDDVQPRVRLVEVIDPPMQSRTRDVVDLSPTEAEAEGKAAQYPTRINSATRLHKGPREMGGATEREREAGKCDECGGVRLHARVSEDVALPC